MSQILRYTGNDIQPIDFEPWLEGKPEVLRPIAKRWFDVIRYVGDDVEAIFHDNYPIGCVENAPFAYVNVFTKHVNIGFFYGAELPDKMKLMEGSGKRMRHIKLWPDKKIDEHAIADLINLSYVDIKSRLMLE